jgi:DNA-binding CsgD family transcriptional regulator
MKTKKITRRGIAYCVQSSVECESGVHMNAHLLSGTAVLGPGGMFVFVVGALMGWVCCFLAIQSGLPTQAVPIFVLLALGACLLFAMVRVAEAAFAGMGRSSVVRSCPVGKAADEAAEGRCHPAEEGDQASSDEEFSRRCDLVAKQTGLSRREREVLGLLARGRNADYIKDALFISACTAKSHIYNVYRKLGVHDRQSVIDRVESADGVIEPYELW